MVSVGRTLKAAGASGWGAARAPPEISCSVVAEGVGAIAEIAVAAVVVAGLGDTGVCSGSA